MAIYSGNVNPPKSAHNSLEEGTLSSQQHISASGFSLLRLSPGLAISTCWDPRLVLGMTVCWEPDGDHRRPAKPPTHHLSVPTKGVRGRDPRLITSVLSHPVPTRYTFQNSIYNAERLHTRLRIRLSTRWERHCRGPQPPHFTVPGEPQSFCSKQKANSANSPITGFQQ